MKTFNKVKLEHMEQQARWITEQTECDLEVADKENKVSLEKIKNEI
jgi:hypothetical protein